MKKFENKIVLVTGAGRGIGASIAKRFASEGAEVIVNYSGNDEAAQKTVDEITATGGQAQKYKCSVNDSESVKVMIDEIIKKFGRIDILVNNAGIIKRCDAIDVPKQDWDSVINVNLNMVFLLCQAFAKQYVKQGDGGKIINVCSMLSFQGGIRVPAYTASKSAVMGLTKALANEWASKGIQVNAIAPGYMATNNTSQLRSDADRSEAILDRIPAGRWGTPEDMQGAVVFLASKASDYVNGYTVAVDGGWLAR